jgi:hypothetical protein
MARLRSESFGRQWRRCVGQWHWNDPPTVGHRETQMSAPLVYRGILAISIVVSCLYILFRSSVSSLPGKLTSLTSASRCHPDDRPLLCAHRIVGDEGLVLGPRPLKAMRVLWQEGIQCFDADVVRCDMSRGTAFYKAQL